jgi:hypothetical protein
VSDASGGRRTAIAAPLVVGRTEHALAGALLLVIAFLWIATAIYGHVANKPAVVPGFGIAGPYLAGTLGVALAILALDWMLRGQAVLIGPRRGRGDQPVVVRESHLAGAACQIWRNPRVPGAPDASRWRVAQLVCCPALAP